MKESTRLKKRQLELLSQFRDSPISVAGLIWSNRHRYGVFVAQMFVITAVVFWRFGAIGVEFAGVAFGATLLRDVAYMRRSKANWPLMCEIIDWEKLERMKIELGKN